MTLSKLPLNVDILHPSEPMLVPAVLLFCGLLATLLALIHVRRREEIFKGKSRVLRLAGRVALVGYLLISVSAYGLAGLEVVQRWQLFVTAHWENNDGVLVLERWGPIPDVHVSRTDVTTITEFSLIERSMFGKRRSVQFVVKTASGESHWSAHYHRRLIVDMTRDLLISATDQKLERFVVGDQNRYH